MKRMSFLLLALCLFFSLTVAVWADDGDWLVKYCGEKLELPDGGSVAPETLHGKMVGFYFTSEGCGFCKEFSPKLVKFRNKLVSRGKPFEVVLVSMDETKARMRQMIREYDMPFPAIPHSSIKRRLLSERFHAYGTPILVVVNQNGEIIAKDGRPAVEHEGTLAYLAWRLGLPPISTVIFYFLPTPYQLRCPSPSILLKFRRMGILFLCGLVVWKIVGAIVWKYKERQRAKSAATP